MADEVATRLCLPDDIEAVIELWLLAGSTSSITDTSGDLRRVLEFGASTVILAVTGSANDPLRRRGVWPEFRRCPNYDRSHNGSVHRLVGGDAGALPYADGEFGLVVCQQGFQFFPDRVQVVKEVYRVLKPGGWVGIAAWSALEQRSGYLAVAPALGKTVGPKAARLLDELFVFPRSGEVEHFFAQGGFPNADVKTPRINTVFNSVDEFTGALAVGSIMRRPLTRFSEETLGSLVAEVTDEMASYVSADGLHLPMEAQMLTASK